MTDAGTVQQAKARLRAEMLARRRALPEEVVERRSAVIQARLIEHPGFVQARVIALYIGVRGEVKTDRLLTFGLEARRRMAAPISDHALGTLRFAVLHDPPGELRPARFGLLEPDPEHCPSLAPGELDLIVVPGVAFDRRGFRLGHGNGFYDRFLPLLRSDCLCVGLAYDFQMVERLPAEEHDVRLDLVVTETTLLDCRSNEKGGAVKGNS